jgi:MYXO-CTERM domain-containing protein
MRRGGLANAQGTVIMSGGSLSVGGTMYVGSGSTNTSNGTGTVSLSGSSSLTAAITLGSATQALGTGTFHATGSDLIVGDGGTARPLTVNDFGTINFNLGATSGSAWNYAASAVTFNAGSAIVVDGTNYTGPDGTFTLINGASLVGTAATVDEGTVNFAPGRTATIEFDTASGDVTLAVATVTPEPASAGVLAMAGLIGVGARRRRR